MTKRAFTPTAPIHIDGTGAIVQIVSRDLTFDYHGVRFPLLGVRYEPDGTVEEARYTLAGGFKLDGEPCSLDLHDVDLTTIRAVRVLGVTQAAASSENSAGNRDSTKFPWDMGPDISDDELRALEHAGAFPSLTLAEAQDAWEAHVRGEIDIDVFDKAK